MDILSHTHRWNQIGLLIHHTDPQLLRIARIVKTNLPTFEKNDPIIRLIDSTENLDQRGLISPVFPQKNVYFRLLYIEIHIYQRQDARKGFVYLLDFEQIRGHTTII